MKSNLSIIVIAYNTPEQYLQKCIESIIKQTYSQIEIIIVDDGSENNVSETIKKYNDNRIKIIRQENQGESVARNVGIQATTTDNIMFVDSDDWIEPNTCEKINNYIKQIKDYEIIIFNTFVDFKNKSIPNKFYDKIGKLDKEDIEQLQLQNIEKGIVKYYPPKSNISVICSKVYNKKFIEKNDLKFIPKIIRMPDALFNMEALEKAKNIYVMEEYLYHYQQNPFSICNRYSEKTIEYYEKYIKLVQEYIKKYNKGEKFIDTLNIKTVTSIDVCMNNYFFNKSNPKNFKETEKEFKELLESDMYAKALKDVKKQYLSKYQKLVLINAQKANIRMLKVLRKIKNIIKKFCDE